MPLRRAAKRFGTLARHRARLLRHLFLRGSLDRKTILVHVLSRLLQLPRLSAGERSYWFPEWRLLQSPPIGAFRHWGDAVFITKLLVGGNVSESLPAVWHERTFLFDLSLIAREVKLKRIGFKQRPNTVMCSATERGMD